MENVEIRPLIFAKRDVKIVGYHAMATIGRSIELPV